MRPTTALLVALLAVPLDRDRLVTQSLVEQRLGETWRWRELSSPDRGPPTFRSVRPWGEGGLIAGDTDGLAWTDGYGWTRAPGWDQVGVGEVFDVVPVSGGVFVISDGSLMGIDDQGGVVQSLTLRHPRRLMPALRRANGAPLLAMGEQILALESVGPAGQPVVRQAPAGTSGINAVAIDGVGALWAATDEGLFRDTGAGWQPMQPLKGAWPPPRPMVRAVVAPAGIYFLPEKIEAGSVPWYWDGQALEPLEGEVRPGTVCDATTYVDGTLIVATSTPTLKVYAAGVGRDVPLGLSATENILSVCVASDGRLALVTARKQLWVADLSSDRWETFETDAAGAGRRVNALAVSAQGGLWLGTDHGILRFHDRQFSDFHAQAGETGIPLEGITSILEDDEGRVWVASGATFRGVLCLENGRWRLLDGPQDVGARYTHSIKQIGGSIWFSQLEGDRGPITNGQLVRLERGVFTRFDTAADGRPLPRCYDVAAAPDGRLFAALLDDVYVFDGQAWSRLGLTELEGARPFALHWTGDGTLWIGLGLEHPGIVQWRDGVARRLDSGDWRRAAAADFCETEDGRLWVTSLSGAFLAHGGGCAELSTRQPVREFWPILADDDGTLWLGSLGNGLVHLQPDDLEGPKGLGDIEISYLEDGQALADWDVVDRWQMTPRDELRFQVTIDGAVRPVNVTWPGPQQMHRANLGLLDPGDHELSVVGVDMYENVGSDALRKDFVVPAPAWRSPPMLVAMGALALTMVVVAFVLANRRRERRAAQRRQAELAERLSVLTRRLFSSAEDERRKLSRELHDDLGQALTSIGLDLQIAERKGQTPSGRIATERALNTVRGALDRVRAISSMLRPAVLDDLGLEQAVRTMLSEFTTRTGVDGQLEFELQGARVPDAVAGHVYRILQEALTNVARHASASTAFVDVRVLGERIELTVKDDGSGFLTAGVPTSQRFGLLGMRERSELMGGSFVLESAPSAGTTIRVSIPLKPHDAAPDPA